MNEADCIVCTSILLLPLPDHDPQHSDRHHPHRDRLERHYVGAGGDETALQIELLFYHFAGPSTWGGQTECTTDLVQPRLCEVLTGKRSNFLSTASISNILYRQ